MTFKNDEQIPEVIDFKEIETDDQNLPTNPSNSISKKAIDDTTFIAQSVSSAWDIFCRRLHQKLGGTDEAAEWVATNTAYMRKCAIETSLVAGELSRYVEEFVIPRNVMSPPVNFKLADLVNDVQQKATYIPSDALNIWGAGTDDPNWETKPLPVDTILNFMSTGITRIPIKCETHSGFIYGYLELFSYETLHEGKIIRMTSEFPSIRVKDKYIPISYVIKWKEISESDVKNVWLRCNGVINKKE